MQGRRDIYVTGSKPQERPASGLAKRQYKERLQPRSVASHPRARASKARAGHTTPAAFCIHAVGLGVASRFIYSCARRALPAQHDRVIRG
jgi:hypothetical protein